MRFKVFRRSLKVVGFKNFLIQGLQGSKGQRVSRHVGISDDPPGNNLSSNVQKKAFQTTPPLRLSLLAFTVLLLL